jgi:hypothetical protein
MNNFNFFLGFFLIFLILSGFYIINDDIYLEKEEIHFSKKDIGRKMKYSMKIPKSDSISFQLLKNLGGHGYGFQFIYSDSSIIYYSNDWALMTPNYTNYHKMNLTPFGNRLIDLDTVIAGKQSNGLNWKEIINDGSMVGYINVSNKNKEFYEHSIFSIQGK